MIDEDVLRDLLSEAADAAPPPGRLPEQLLAHLEREAPTVARRRFEVGPLTRTTPRFLAVAAAVLAAVVGLTTVLAVGGGSGPDDVAVSLDESPQGPPTTVVFPDGDEQLDTGSDGNVVVPGDGAGSAGVGGGGATPPRLGPVAPPAAPPAAPADSATVIKVGSMSLEVDRGGFQRALDLITTKAAGLGGYVTESTTSELADRPTGTVVLRVPAAQLEQFLADLRQVGRVLAEDSKGTEVSGAIADVEARLRALRATRDKLDTVLAEAQGVDQILLVQDRITGVQTQIEQLEGQRAALADQVTMATITVSLGEPGSQRTEVRSDDDDGLSGAWAEARRRFGDGVEGVLSWSGSAAVVLLVLLALAVPVRLLWPIVRRRLFL